MKHYHIATLVIAMLSSSTILCENINNISKEKRQIFREQVLPFKGGKIPESALRSDRLNLNQLQKEGFSLPDGVVLYNRRHLRHPFPYHQEPELLKVFMTDDGRYVSVYGKYTTDVPDTIDTTYLIRSPIQLDYNEAPINNLSEFPEQRIFKPSLLSLVIPTNAIFGKSLKDNELYSRQPSRYIKNEYHNVPYTQRQNNFHFKQHHNIPNYFKENALRSDFDNVIGKHQQDFHEKSRKKIFIDHSSASDCKDCVHNTNYKSPKSRVTINRYYKSSQNQWR